MEITAIERPAYYTVNCDSCGYDLEWTMRVEPRGEGSTLTLDVTSKARTFIGKLMTPLGWLMSGMMKKCVVKDVDNIKARNTAHPHPPAARLRQFQRSEDSCDLG